MKKTSVILAIALPMVLLQLLSCHKKDNPPPPPPTGGTGDYTFPNLPAVPFDYTRATIPAYISEFIASDHAIDNTPADNPITNAGATLGRVLFYDRHLSVNDKIACASCHKQEKAFTDGNAFSPGFDGGLTTRNAMSTVNLRYFKAKKMFWDLRAADLETQVLMPIQNQVEMGMPSLADLVNKLKNIPYYPSLFKAAFGTEEVSSDRIAKALAQFLRSIVSFNSKYDQGLGNDFAAFTPQELHGLQMVNRAFCAECHSDLTHVAAKQNPSFIMVENFGQNTGFGSNNGLDDVFADNGIGGVTKTESDMGTFKIPTLRNVELTAPYMHDGRFTTLEQVIDHYATGVKRNPNLGIQLFPPGFGFSDQEKQDIVAFLKTLTDNSLITDPRFSDPFK